MTENDMMRRGRLPAASLAASTGNLLSWYDRAARQLPWRRFWPELAPAYHVFLSELMLQQTTVTTVIPYFNDFIRRWPDIDALAGTDLSAVLDAWAGLGYYARARNMHKAAIAIVSTHDGQFPRDRTGLLSLPGIGPYTAGAILAIAFDQPALVADGNIERVIARFFGIDTPLPQLKKQIAEPYRLLIPASRRSDFPQSLMDLGALICTPQRPRCQDCPISRHCRARLMDDPALLPVRPAKKPRPIRRGRAFVLLDGQGRAVMLRRPDSGLLGGLPAFPSDGWDKTGRDQLGGFDSAHNWQPVAGPLVHIFTHFQAEIDIWLARADLSGPEKSSLPAGWFWAEPDETGLSSLMQKIWQAAKAADA